MRLFFRGFAAQRQQFNPPRQRAGKRSLLAERHELGNTEKQCIDQIDDRPGITSRDVLFAAQCAVLAHQIIGCHREQARLGTAEAINRLFGVTNEKNTGARRIGIGIEPGQQNLPLQGVGVLKLVEQHMAVPRIQTGLQNGRRSLVAQELQHRPLGIDKIDLPPRFFVFIDMREESGENGTGIGIQGNDALRNLLLDTRQHTLAQARMQIEEVRHALSAKALLGSLAGLALTQGIFVGEQYPAQHLETCCRIRLSEHRGDACCMRLIAGQLAHFKKTKVNLQVGRPGAGKKRFQRVAFFFHA